MAVAAKAEDPPDGERTVVVSRVRKLMNMMESVPKTFGWKMRARIVERTRWYELPERDGDAMLV